MGKTLPEMRLNYGIWCMIIGLLFGCSSCSTTKAYALGEEFTIALEGEGNGGFVWNYEKIPQIQTVDSLKTETQKANGFFEYRKSYTFKGTQKGTYKIRFIKRRPFEPELVLEHHIKDVIIKIKR